MMGKYITGLNLFHTQEEDAIIIKIVAAIIKNIREQLLRIL